MYELVGEGIRLSTKTAIAIGVMISEAVAAGVAIKIVGDKKHEAGKIEGKKAAQEEIDRYIERVRELGEQVETLEKKITEMASNGNNGKNNGKN